LNLPGCLLGWYTIVSCRRCRCTGRNCARRRWCGGRRRAAHRDRLRRCCRGFGCTSGQNQVDQREHNQCSFHCSFSFRQSEPPNGLRFSCARSEGAKRLAGCARCTALRYPLRRLARCVTLPAHAHAPAQTVCSPCTCASFLTFSTYRIAVSAQN